MSREQHGDEISYSTWLVGWWLVIGAICTAGALVIAGVVP